MKNTKKLNNNKLALYIVLGVFVLIGLLYLVAYMLNTSDGGLNGEVISPMEQIEESMYKLMNYNEDFRDKRKLHCSVVSEKGMNECFRVTIPILKNYSAEYRHLKGILNKSQKEYKYLKENGGDIDVFIEEHSMYGISASNIYTSLVYVHMENEGYSVEGDYKNDFEIIFSNFETKPALDLNEWAKN